MSFQHLEKFWSCFSSADSQHLELFMMSHRKKFGNESDVFPPWHFSMNCLTLSWFWRLWKFVHSSKCHFVHGIFFQYLEHLVLFSDFKLSIKNFLRYLAVKIFVKIWVEYCGRSFWKESSISYHAYQEKFWHLDIFRDGACQSHFMIIYHI